MAAELVHPATTEIYVNRHWRCLLITNARTNQNAHFNRTIKEFSLIAIKNVLLLRLPTEFLNVICYYWNDYFHFKFHLLMAM